MVKFFKSLLAILAIVVISFCSYSFFIRQFKLSNIKGDWPSVSYKKIADEQLNFLKEVFSQEFYYLDRGKQAFVFASKDKKYVLKFFDVHCLRSGSSSFLFSINKEECFKKMEALFKGYELAEARLKDTGLLFLQLTPDPSYSLSIVAIDRFNIKHHINLAEVPFVLQKMATPLRELVSSLLDRQKVVNTEHRLRQIIDMYVEQYRLGIVDLDYNFMYNTGFIGDYPLRIDLGRVVLNEEFKNPKVYQQDLKKIEKRLEGWLERHYPKYRREILDDFKMKLAEISESSTFL